MVNLGCQNKNFYEIVEEMTKAWNKYKHMLPYSPIKKDEN
jgi:hypothetical protein